MDFIDQITAISQQVPKLRDSVKTEEATKNAFVLPLINALGYNVFDTTEVCPEYIAATPGLKGEKVDYAIIINNEPSILIECKWCGENLQHPKHGSQLYKYFNATSAKFGVLTNGILYQFYTDIDKNNIMDETPFFEFSITNFNESSVNELKRFSKAIFNPDEMVDVAINLLYTREIKRLMAEQLTNPSPDFVKFFAGQVYSGRIGSSVITKFTELVKKSLKEYVNDRITDRLQSAINLPDATAEVEDNSTSNGEKNTVTPDDEVSVTQEEMDSFYLLKSILREVVDTSRLQYKGTKNYFGVNIDGSAKKTICRLWLNSKNKYIGIFDVNNKVAKQSISDLDDIYGFSEILKDRAKFLTPSDLEQTQAAER